MLEGWLWCLVPQTPRVSTTIFSGGGGPTLLLMFLLPVPSTRVLGGFAAFLLCNSSLVYHEQASKETSCTVHLSFMYGVESNQ